MAAQMLTLRTKFFVTILAVNVVLAIGLYLFLRFSFEESFTRYVSQRERDQAETLATRLEEFYRTQGNWTQFVAQPQTWTAFSKDIGRPQWREPGGKREPDGKREEKPPPLPPDGFGGGPREPGGGPPSPPLFLLDQNHQLVAGMKWSVDESYLRDLRVAGKVVGYLGIPIRREMRDYLDQQFASGQSKNLVVIVVATFLMALIIAIPLSYLLVNRISRLVKYVQQLSQGHYDQSLSLRGNDELNMLGEHLQQLGNTLAKAKQQRNQWVSDISHELRTPVAILQADLEAIEDGVRDMGKPAVARLLKHTHRLKNLIEDLHNLSLSDLGSMSYRKVACDLQAVVNEAAAMLASQFQQRGLTLRSESENVDDYTVLGDSQRLAQLVLNLLQNSLNYTDAPGTVSIAMRRDADSVVMEINDSAPGVARELQSKLTERLFRVDASRARNSGGAGLGLSLCANIVAAHGGNINFRDSTLGGLTVIVKIPHHGVST